MNPDNNALERTYFVGGSPRVGKSLISFELAKEVGGHVVSTDSIRNAARKASGNQGGDLFIVNRMENAPENEWLQRHLWHPEEVVAYQNKESVALWPPLVSFCNSFVEDDAVHIVEGVALLPSLVAGMKNPPRHIAYVGNTSETHAEAMLAHARDFPARDWMGALGYGEEKIRAMARFVREMSEYFKNEAARYGFPYYEIRDGEFEKSIAAIVRRIAEARA